MQIAAICQEAGMHAVRKNRYVILPKDFEKGYRTNVKKPDTDFEFYKWWISVGRKFEYFIACDSDSVLLLHLTLFVIIHAIATDITLCWTC